MSEKLYVASSLFFLTGSLLAFAAAPTFTNSLFIAGSLFFLLAALSALFPRRK